MYKPHEYGEVILPLTVIRRFDCILDDTKAAVLERYAQCKTLAMPESLLCRASGHAFYNVSRFDFGKLLDDPDNIEANFRAYLYGFSANVRDIIEKFRFEGHIATMAEKGILYTVLREFTTPRADLHPDRISNLEMGYIFEEIIRRFSESHNADAGQHYTPREVIELMVNILFHDDHEALGGNNILRSIYDPACGTGGMLSVAEEYLHRLNPTSALLAFGQELNDQTYAICKAGHAHQGQRRPQHPRRQHPLGRPVPRADLRLHPLQSPVRTGMEERKKRRRTGSTHRRRRSLLRRTARHRRQPDAVSADRAIQNENAGKRRQPHRHHP